MTTSTKSQKHVKKLSLPFCDPTGIFYNHRGQSANNPTDLAKEPFKVDHDAVFSVLQLGAIVPPLSPWLGVQRYLPGYRYQGSNNLGPVKVEPLYGIGKALNPNQQADEIERQVDKVLLDQIGDREDPVLLFSGGVDSGFIASRLVALGYHNCLLLNFSFGASDPEADLARAMAKHLKLRFESVSTRLDLCQCLDHPGRVYPQPFGDHSAVPTSDFAHSVIERLSGRNRVIIDGTGADGAFGMTGKIKNWQRVLRIPPIVRNASSMLYNSGFWRRESRLEYLLRVLRRSVDMPILSAVLAQNPLAGILYHEGSRSRVDGHFNNWVGDWVAESLPQDAKVADLEIVAADLALTCANIYAQKAHSILEGAGHKVIYPFLEDGIVATAMAANSQWNMGEPKDPLKRSLTRYVPHSMVYRNKSGFSDPRLRVFYESRFISHLRASADPTGPIASMLKAESIREACDLLSQKKRLPEQTISLLWAITFTDRWYRTSR